MGQRVNQVSVQVLAVPSAPKAHVEQLAIQLLTIVITESHGLSSYLRDQLCNHIFRSGTFAKPAALYVALYQLPPNQDGGGTEFSGGGYRRKLIFPDDGRFTAPTAGNGTTANGEDFVFDTPTADWGLCSAWGIFDAETGGNFLAWSTLTAGVTITAGSNPRFVAGNLTIQLDT